MVSNAELEKGLLQRKSFQFNSPVPSLPPSSPPSQPSDSETEDEGRVTSSTCFRTPTSSPTTHGGIIQQRALAPKKSQLTFGAKLEAIEEANAPAPLKPKFERRLSRSVTESSLRSQQTQMLPPLTGKVGSKVQRPQAAQSLRSSTISSKPALSRRPSIGREALSRSVSDQSNHEVVRSKSRSSLLGNGPCLQEPTRTTGARRVPVSSAAPVARGHSRLSSATSVEAPPAAVRTGPQRPPQTHRPVASVSSFGINRLSSSISNIRSLSRSTTASDTNKPVPSKSSATVSSRLPMPQTKAASRLPAPASRKVF